MIQYRPFVNSDPPGLARVWQAQPPYRGLARQVTPAQLDQLVLSKLYFDRAGLIVAEEAGELWGYAHAGFGPDASRTGLDRRVGATCMLLVRPHPEQDRIASELLQRCEGYLRDRGAQVLLAGGSHRINPFYTGFYGGMEVPGVLASHATWRTWFGTAGYQEQAGPPILQRSLRDFRPPMDRHMLQWRRQFRLESVEDPAGSDWWDNQIWGLHRRTLFALHRPDAADPRATALAVEVEPLATSAWGTPARGVLKWDCPSGDEGPAFGTFFLSEILKQLATQGIGMVELQPHPDDALLLQSVSALGFREVDRGLQLTKGE